MALLSAFKGGKGGVAAPSANKFGNVSPTTAHHVRDEFGDDGQLGAVLDGGSSQVGIESTILDLSRLATHGPVLLRPGHITAHQIADVIGVMPAAPDQAAPRASGTLESHYAPKAPVALLAGDKIVAALASLAAKGRRVALIRYSDAPAGAMLAAAAASGGAGTARLAPHVALPAEPAGYAFGLYAALRAMDRANVDLIVVETPPQTEAWHGINDRLRRAAHGATGIIDRLLA
jgi:L-threonylcarbamoyladenylate synthase